MSDTPNDYSIYRGSVDAAWLRKRIDRAMRDDCDMIVRAQEMAELCEALEQRDSLRRELASLREAAEPFAEAWRLRAQRPAQTSGNKVRERRDLEAGFYSIMKPDGERYLLTGEHLKRIGEAYDMPNSEGPSQ